MTHESSLVTLVRPATAAVARWALLLAVVSGAWPAPALAQTTGTITGAVTDAVWGGPIAGVWVYLYNSAGDYMGSAASNTAGVYARANLAAGTYYLRTSNGLGYLDELYDDVPCASSCYPYTSGAGVAVTAGMATSGIDFALTKGGTITGTVRGEPSGTLLAGVRVNIYDSTGNNVASVTTTVSGAYSKNGLSSGSYYLRTSNNLGFLDELYDNLPCSGGCWPYTQGTPVNVTAGATAGGIDFALSLGGSITGTVTDTGSGAPLAGVQVEARSLSGSYFQANATTNASGVYTLIGLPTRSYEVFTFNGAGYIDEKYDDVSCPSGCWQVSGTPVAVTAGNVTPAIDFGLVLGGTIAGTVTDSSTTAPAPNVEVGVHNAAGRSLRFAVTNAAGQYAVTGLPAGTHYVKTVAFGNYLSEVYADIPCPSCYMTSGASITIPAGATGVPVSIGGTHAGIDFALAPGGSITGTVTDASTGAPLDYVHVEASNGTVTRSVQSDASGVYSIVGLFTGAYRVRVQTMFGSGHVNEVYDNQPCPDAGCSSVAGTPVAVTAGSATTGIDFALAPGGTITGTVRDAASGAPLPYPRVSVYRAGAENSSFWGSGNGSGIYTVTGLPTGTYYVIADGDNFVDELYGGLPCPYEACTVSDGTPVSVTIGQTTSGIDFALSRGGAISGTVTDAASGLPVDVEVEVLLYSSTGRPMDYTYAHEGTGTYTLGGLPTGTYYIRVWSPEYVMETYNNLPGYTPITGGTPINVAAPATTSGIDFQLARGGTITGTLAVEGTGEPVHEEPFVYAVSSDGRTVVSFGEVTGTGYVLPGLPPGSYYVRTFNGDGLMDEVYRDVPCLLCDPTAGQLVTVTGTETIPGIDFTLAPLPAATNDSCSDALEVTSTPFTHLVSVAGATGVFGDPLQSCGSLAPTDSKSVWYRFTPPRKGTLTIRTAGSTTRPVISVYTGSCGAFVEIPGGCVCASYWNPVSEMFWRAPEQQAGELRVALTGGVTYSIQVANDDSDGATLNLSLDFTGAAATDFTGDAKSDILWRHEGAGAVWLWPMDGAAKASESYVRAVPDPDWEIRGQGDLNGDGKADILWRNRTTGLIYYWPMDGATPLAETYVSVVSTAYDILGTGDFTGDGKADILWRNGSGDLWIWPMDGATVLDQVYAGNVDPGYQVKGIGDLNGDGMADLVWHGASGDVWVWPMNGTVPTTQSYVGLVSDVRYQIQQVADFDGNGKADLLWWNTEQGEVWIWPMDGATLLSQDYVGWVPDTNYRIEAAGDYDGDGKADILWRHAAQGDVWVWLMNGVVKASETRVGFVPDTQYQIVKPR